MTARFLRELSVSRAPHAAAPAAAIFSLARTSRAGRRRALRLRTAPDGRGGAGRGGLCARVFGGRWWRVVSTHARWMLSRARGGREEGVRAAGSGVYGRCESEVKTKLCLQSSGVVREQASGTEGGAQRLVA